MCPKVFVLSACQQSCDEMALESKVIVTVTIDSNVLGEVDRAVRANSVLLDFRWNTRYEHKDGKGCI